MKKLHRASSGFFNSEEGSIIIIVAVGLVVFLSFVAMAVDTGVIYYQESKLQTAMDAAALAAVRELPDQSAARDVAIEYVIKNGFTEEDVVVEFPTNETVRVKKSDSVKTDFATIFGVRKVNIAKKATAKYISKSVALNFDYLLYTGSPSCTIRLGAVFQLAGSMHSNYMYNLNGATSGGVCWVSGAVEGCAGGYIPNGANDNYRVTVGTSDPEAPFIEMPEFGTMMEAIIPELPSSYIMPNRIWPNNFYPVLSSGVITSDYSNPRYENPININQSCRVIGTYNGWPGLNVNGDLYFYNGCSSLGSASVIQGDLYCRGSMTKGSGELTVYGDCGINGDFSMSCATTIGGDLYVNGNLSVGGGRKLVVGGNVYVNGNIDADSRITAGGDILANGFIDCSSGATCDGDIFSAGYMYYGGQTPALTMNGGVCYSSSTLTFSQGYTVNGCLFAYGDIKSGGMPNVVDTGTGTLSVYSQTGNIDFYAASTAIYGIVYAPNGQVTIRGNTCEFYGSIICDSLGGSIPARLIMGANPRELPYVKTVKSASLIE